jgi:hypothetical protein
LQAARKPVAASARNADAMRMISLVCRYGLVRRDCRKGSLAQPFGDRTVA